MTNTNKIKLNRKHSFKFLIKTTIISVIYLKKKKKSKLRRGRARFTYSTYSENDVNTTGQLDVAQHRFSTRIDLVQ